PTRKGSSIRASSSRPWRAARSTAGCGCIRAPCPTQSCRASEAQRRMSASLDAVLGELRERIAAAQGARRALRLKGAGTKDFYGETLAGEVLELGAFSGIVDYEPSELVLTARCGTALSEIEAAPSARGQLLGCEPAAIGPAPTVLGAAGSWRRRGGILPPLVCGGLGRLGRRLVAGRRLGAALRLAACGACGARAHRW